MQTITKLALTGLALAVCAAARPLAIADTPHAPQPSEPRAVQTFSVTIALPPRSQSADVEFPVVPCAAGESFLVSSVQVAPDASARESDELTGKWALTTVIGQSVGENMRESGLTVIGEKAAMASATLPAGQPFLRKMRLRVSSEHASAISFVAHVSGACGVPSKLSADPLVVAAPPAPVKQAYVAPPVKMPAMPNNLPY